MKIISNVPIQEIKTYKEMVEKLKKAFGNSMFWGESTFSLNDRNPNSIIIEGSLYKWYDKEKDIMSKIKVTFIVNENKIEHSSCDVDVFYEHKNEEMQNRREYIIDLKDKYNYTIMFMKVTPLKLYRLICVLFAEELKINDFLLEEDKLEFYGDDIFLQSLREE